MKKIQCFILFSLIVISNAINAQPRSIIAECFTSSNERINLYHISSELDVYAFEVENKSKVINSRFWNFLLNNQFMVDYDYNFGKEVKTDSVQNYFLILKPTHSNSVEIRIHQANGSKTLVKKIECLKH